MKYPNFLLVAARHPDPSWVYIHFWTSIDRVNLDQWLVRLNHPLAYRAGTNEDRFRQIIAEIKENENGKETVQSGDVHYSERFLET
jgi:hypothetical protein